ncbi:unnamed protein product [Trifolium pratense]|uniref:Uncharacterized protein n=1 Tax=Trifolium pratense TaxID=57577 RepID=A0ACB0ITD2_TRIPR|nr:unnamed protein product [Trifolium pratense]
MGELKQVIENNQLKISTWLTILFGLYFFFEPLNITFLIYSLLSIYTLIKIFCWYLFVEIMNSFARKFYIISMLFLSLVLLLVISICEVEAELCREESKMWRGPCFFSDSECNTWCIKSEVALFGACEFPFACVCYFTCEPNQIRDEQSFTLQ